MAEVARLFPMDESDEIRAEALREATRIAEALIFASSDPVEESDIGKRMPEGIKAIEALEALREHYASRGINLIRVNKKWTFRTAADLGWLMSRETSEPKKLSRPAIETLAIIAYHQPVTRAEIEDIRGVAISKGTLDVLMETGWVRLRGRRRAPGRPVTYGTTDNFLLHFGLETIGDLPGLDELKAAGMFDGRLPEGFGVPQPRDGAELTEDEEPLEEGAVDLFEEHPPAEEAGQGGSQEAGEPAAQATADGEPLAQAPEATIEAVVELDEIEAEVVKIEAEAEAEEAVGAALADEVEGEFDDVEVDEAEASEEAAGDEVEMSAEDADEAETSEEAHLAEEDAPEGEPSEEVDPPEEDKPAD